jgi:hypothetical protein
VANNTFEFEFPYNVFILPILSDEIHEFIVCDYLLVLIIIDRDPKLVVVIRHFEVILMVLNKFHNMGTILLPILLPLNP